MIKQLEDSYKFINNIFKDNFKDIVKLSILDYMDDNIDEDKNEEEENKEENNEEEVKPLKKILRVKKNKELKK